MSAWQRIGIVLSLLWVFGFPIYLVIDQNRHANEGDRLCRDTTSTMASRWRREGRSDLAEAQEKVAPQECREGAGYTTLSELARGLFMGGTNTEIAPELTGHGLPLSKCEAYNRVYEQFYRSR